MEGSVSVVGLGKLGLGLALSFASSGIKVLGVDVNDHVVQSINSGTTPIVEPQYQELITAHSANFSATRNHADAIEKTDTTFVLVATPSIGDGRFSNRYVKSALRSLAEALRQSSKPYHLFVISSTVVPGSTNKSFIPLLEQYSGRKLNQGFGVCYDPDFVALGTVVRDFLNPDLIVIGESDQRAGDQVVAIHEKACQSKPVMARMPIISAEVAKVSLNAYITMKISFANTLANICEKIPGADVDAITNAIGVDKRISPYYLKGGLGYGGTCFPRDTKAFITIARQFGDEAELIQATERVNEHQARHLSALVMNELNEERKVSVLGLAFKTNTPVIEESPAIKLMHDLVNEDIDVTVYDPLALTNTYALFDDELTYADSAAECLGRSPVCVITLQDAEYKRVVEDFAPEKPVTVIDCWRILDPGKLHANIRYIAVGRAISA
jgi:UDPglucose 6-dehydrogenase